MHHEIGLDAILIDRHDLARKHVTDEGSTDRVKRTCLGSQDIGIIALSDTERFESLRIAGADQLSRAGDHKGVGTLDLLHRVCHGFLSGSHLTALSRDVVSNDLRVDRGLENRSVISEFSAKLRRIDKVSIVCQCQSSLHII